MNITLKLFLFSILVSISGFSVAVDNGTWNYDVNSDGTSITLTGCSGDISNPTTISCPSTLIIPEKIDGFDVTAIEGGSGNGAFMQKDLIEITIPDSVVSIGGGAFYGNYQLANLSLSNSLIEIASYAFAGNSLETISIPESVIRINEMAFGFNSGQLKHLHLPEKLTHIGEMAFLACGLTSLTIPKNVAQIGERAFGECKLKSLTLSNNFKYPPMNILSDGTFATDDPQPNYPLNAELYIGARAFEKNELTSVTIPDSTRGIGAQAFNDNSLVSVHFLGRNSSGYDYLSFDQNSTLSNITFCSEYKYVENQWINSSGGKSFFIDYDLGNSILVTEDCDGDGLPDSTDHDDDNDGVLDSEDHFPNDPLYFLDTDGAGVPNAIDFDDDNDSVADADDPFPLDKYAWTDTDGDGLADDFPSLANNPWIETSNISVTVEPLGENSMEISGLIYFDIETNYQAILAVSASRNFHLDINDERFAGQENPQNEPVYDFDTPLSEGSYSIRLLHECWGFDQNNDFYEECYLNPTARLDVSIQKNYSNKTPAGTLLDDDDDNDGVIDVNDAFPKDANETVDTDLDGVGNNTDTDDDGDGSYDNEDAFPLDFSETVDSDSDGVGDNSDAFPNNSLYKADSDFDGMPDAWEARYGLDPNDASDATSDQDNDGVTALDEFLAGTIPSGSLDIDGNENYDALTDGLLLLRGMFGLDGSALVTGTIPSDAAYTESVDIESRIATLGDLADIDGNGTIDALTDGLLTLRYLFGLQGDTLINGVVASDATRKTAEEIEAHLETLMPAL